MTCANPTCRNPLAAPNAKWCRACARAKKLAANRARDRRRTQTHRERWGRRACDVCSAVKGGDRFPSRDATVCSVCAHKRQPSKHCHLCWDMPWRVTGATCRRCGLAYAIERVEVPIINPPSAWAMAMTTPTKPGGSSGEDDEREDAEVIAMPEREQHTEAA